MALVRTTASAPRMDGDFNLEPAAGAALSAAEQAYVSAVAAFLSRCAQDATEDKRRDPESKTTLVAARGRARASLVRTLGEDADEVIAGASAVAIAQERATIAFGRYRQVIDQLARRVFTIGLRIDDATQLATDLVMEVKPAQSEDDPQPSDAQRQLFVAIGSTATVLSGVHAQAVAGRARRWSVRFRRKPAPPAPAAPPGRNAVHASADRLQDEFVRKLEGVARVGLEGNRPVIAGLALVQLRDQFTGQVAGRIKNTYARSLGAACLCAASASTAMGVAIDRRAWVFGDAWWVSKQNFFGLFLGAALGTWLSFLVRRVGLTFDDLAIVEADLLDPSLRVLFVLGLTVLVGLLFWTDAVQIAVGGMQTAHIPTDGSISVLVGAFCGLSERSLATAIAGRAAGFVGSLAAKGGT